MIYYTKLTISLTFKIEFDSAILHFAAVLTIETRLLDPVFHKQNIERPKRILVHFQDGGLGVMRFLFTFGLMKLNINKPDFSCVQNEGW